ncbi:MAG TPA: fumarate/nitrate reduction transcriptional regulator Fnr [Steroidobacteraceae bacterium]|jgi:CRP/FNR family transcriptional regulator
MYAVTAMKSAAAPKKFAVSCSSCNMRELCLPQGLSTTDIDSFEKVVYARRRIKRGEALFACGDEFKAVYSVRSGFFKTSLVDGEGREQVTGFFMGGELLGMDGIGAGRYNGSAIALEDSEVCVLPYSLIEQMATEVPALRRQLHTIMAREIVRDHGVMMLLGSMRAEERLATFLLNLSKRFTARGFSPSDFHLRMTREELGSYLGLKLETVSRLFSRFHDDGLIEVQQKHVRILDSAGLEQVLATRH